MRRIRLFLIVLVATGLVGQTQPAKPVAVNTLFTRLPKNLWPDKAESEAKRNMRQEWYAEHEIGVPVAFSRVVVDRVNTVGGEVYLVSQGATANYFGFPQKLVVTAFLSKADGEKAVSLKRGDTVNVAGNSKKMIVLVDGSPGLQLDLSDAHLR